jgi:hypothetical protein
MNGNKAMKSMTSYEVQRNTRSAAQLFFRPLKIRQVYKNGLWRLGVSFCIALLERIPYNLLVRRGFYL